MNAPRIRIVAGPNGSGKTTLIEYLQLLNLPLGYSLNADAIARDLKENGRMDFSAWGLRVGNAAFQKYLREHALAARIKGVVATVRKNTLEVTGPFAGGYFAAILSDFMRRKWVAAHDSFTFETVMSGDDKMAFLRRLRKSGYRTYLYFICTSSPLINRERVANRVSEGGHDVPPEKIDARYYRSLSLLPVAVGLCSRAYLFDNSGQAHRLIAEFEDGALVHVRNPPAWFTNLPFRTK